MAVIKAVSSKAGIGQALDYVTKEEKTEDKLVSGLHCEPDTVKDEMQATKELWGKTGGRTYKHFVHSYHEDEHITPEQAHKNAIELGASKVFEFYTEDYADTMSLAVFLISLAVSVYFAELIRAVIPINLLLLLILVHIVYVLIRWYVKGCMRSRGYY